MPVYFTFPLEGDPPEVTTLLGLEASNRGADIGLSLTGGLDLRLRVPVGYRVTHAYSRPEVTVALVGSFLADFALAVEESLITDGVHPWPFDGLSNDAWLFHLRQLVSLEERLSRARGSGVADDPRVKEGMRQLPASVEPHGAALREWLERARPQVKRALGVMREDAEMRRVAANEQRVAEVLHDLAGVAEDDQDRPNPDLWRIAGEEPRAGG